MEKQISRSKKSNNNFYQTLADKVLASGLIIEQSPIPSVNEEFNQYMDYHLQRIRTESNGNILIVDDDPMSADYMEIVIHQFSDKIRSFKAASVEEALEILFKIPCDLVIADFFLEGGGTGLELSQKAAVLFPEAKFLMISAMSFDQFRKKNKLSDEPLDFMEKPISMNLIKTYLASFFESI